MKAEESLTQTDLLPTDLIMEIFKRLPLKTLARFLCVSKLWASSLIRSRYFKKLFLAESLKRPGRLFFNIRRGKACCFYSSLQTQKPGKASVATYHMTLPYPRDKFTIMSPSVHGLICHRTFSSLKIYNPSTRRSITLPEFHAERPWLDNHYLGYDPIEGDYKILCMTTGTNGLAQDVQVLTIGEGNQWRMIVDCPPPHSPTIPQICIEGVLYYGACTRRQNGSKEHVIICFDVRNYPGSVHLCVLEDAAKHEWSYKCFGLPSLAGFRNSFQVFCAIDETGEFVLAPRNLEAPPFYVLYYDPEKKSMRRVGIEGITKFWQIGPYPRHQTRTIFIFPDQVENLMFI
ncbi:unnamed protein product [Microthlaspi erraticum]|uniref:F-box domain-containing protein n=1 Tax=Microthlaspi erraticum TaxID=1685480 RepID=A0A6D2K1G5_9BRAS|nr:unnamed protein product [Microthlaspi erraticum]CAA7044840.1 unnamed protein product [Microthlaspi erraticum]